MHPPHGSSAAAEKLALEFLQRVWHPPHDLEDDQDLLAGERHRLLRRQGVDPSDQLLQEGHEAIERGRGFRHRSILPGRPAPAYPNGIRATRR